MTQQYIAGELSLRLGQLQTVVTDQDRACAVARLRYEAETVPLAALGSVVVRALGLADRLCWDSLGCGDALTFSRQAAICAELWEFGICARLFEEDLDFD
jgi:hypothetical protein